MSKLSLEIAKHYSKHYCFSPFSPYSLLFNFFSSHPKFSQMLYTVVVSGVTSEASSPHFAVSPWCSSTSILKLFSSHHTEFPCSPTFPFLASLMIIIFLSSWVVHGFQTWINFGIIFCFSRKMRGVGGLVFVCDQKPSFSAIKSPVSQW